jgi:DNA polymerase-1
MSYTTSDSMLKYNAKDAVGTLQIANKVVPEIISEGYEDTYNHTLSLLRPLMYMMIRGVKVDLAELAKMKVKVDATIIQHQERLNTIAGKPLNVNSAKDLKQYFYSDKGVKPYTKYNKASGKSSETVDDKALQRLARPTSQRDGFEEARLIQRIRQLRKLKGTYLDIVFDKDQRLRCSYNPRGTRFGRLSSSKTIFETGMNMQNLPPAFQKFLVADEDRLILGFDKKQAEWVVVAYISGDASMIKAVESGVDVHTYTASEMFKIPQSIIKQEHKILGSESDVDTIAIKRNQMDFLKPYMRHWLPRNMSMRQCGKKSNHGLNYDETAPMFALINEISEKEADVIIEFYHRIYPGIRQWYERTRSQLSKDRTLVNLFGRKYRFLEKWGPDLFKSAYSYGPQSTVGELVNRAMDSIYDDTSDDTRDLEILMQVHDSIDFQDQYADVPRLVRSIRKVQRYMDIPLQAHGRQFTIGTDLKIGWSMGDMHEIDLRLSDDELIAGIEEFLQKNPRPVLAQVA